MVEADIAVVETTKRVRRKMAKPLEILKHVFGCRRFGRKSLLEAWHAMPTGKLDQDQSMQDRKSVLQSMVHSIYPIYPIYPIYQIG